MSEPVSGPAGRGHILFLATEDWFFCSHFLSIAQAAIAAGFTASVATRSRDEALAARIEAAGVTLIPVDHLRSAGGASALDSDFGTVAGSPDATGPRVRVINGTSAGREMALTKVVTTLGKPGVAVASITRRPHGFDLAHVKGQYVASVNGVGTDAGPITLKNRDQIDLGGVRLEFIDR